MTVFRSHPSLTLGATQTSVPGDAGNLDVARLAAHAWTLAEVLVRVSQLIVDFPKIAALEAKMMRQIGPLNPHGLSRHTTQD
jgi:hypothetical protein